jgi:hypothetical protein
VHALLRGSRLRAAWRVWIRDDDVTESTPGANQLAVTANQLAVTANQLAVTANQLAVTANQLAVTAGPCSPAGRTVLAGSGGNIR